MAASYVLPFAEPPRPEESFFSYLLRMAHIHGFRRPSSLFARLGMTPRTYELVFRKAPELELEQSWAALFGLSVGALRAVAPWKVSGRASNIMGHAIADGCLILGERRICTACVAESGSLHASCHIGLLPHCPIHGLPFQDKCSTCGSGLRWVGDHLGNCSNSDCFAELETPSDDAKLNSEFTYPATILTWLRSDPTVPLDGHGALPGEAIELAFELGRMINGWSRVGARGRGRAETFMRRHSAEMPVIMQAGCDALTDWPNGMFRALDQLLSRPQISRRKGGLEHSYGRLVPWLLTRGSRPWVAQFRQVIALHAIPHSDVQKAAETIVRFGDLDPSDVEFEPLTVAARRIGVTFTTLSSLLIRRPEIIYKAAANQTQATLLRRHAVDALQEEIRDSIMQAEAVRMLGISRESLHDLVRGGLLAEIEPSRRVSERRCLSRRAIEAFITEQRGAAREAAPGEEGAYLSLYRLSLRWDGIATICAAVRDGHLRPARIDPALVGIAAMLFREEEAKRGLAAYLERAQLRD